MSWSLRRGFGAFASLSLLALGGCDGDPPPPPAVRPTVRLAPDPAELRLAGTGAMAPLVELWAEAFAALEPRPRIVVHESIGSGGGIHAAADGVIDLGMVSRPFTEEERRLGLHRVAVGRDAVVLAANPHVSVDHISSDELRALHAGTRHSFADGSPATLLLRDRDESANLSLDAAVPGVRALREEAYRGGRLRVLYHDDAMGEALASIRGSVGVFSLSAVVSRRLPLKVLALDGVTPSAVTLADGRWKATRELAFVVRPDRLEHARRFLAFVTSPDGRRIAERAGCLPAAPLP